MAMNKDINRLKVILVEKKKTNRWLASQLGKDESTVSMVHQYFSAKSRAIKRNCKCT